MTVSKDPKQESDEKRSWLQVFRQHSDTAIKICIFILAALFGALIVIVIYVENPPTKVQLISEVQSTSIRVERIVENVEHEFVYGICRLINTTIGCRNTSEIYEDVFQSLQETELEKDIILYIFNQRFPNQVLANKWIPSNKSIKEVSIANGNFVHIKNEVFNSLDFTNTIDIKLVGVNLPVLGNGVLLGLSKLKSLHIDGKVREVDRCFFQPVQSSLTQLTLSVELPISATNNVFGISNLPYLKTLDLSGNTLLGSISRNFLAAVPNIKCLSLSNSKIVSIEEDAFDDVAENLKLLDLSNNLLTSIDVSSLERILVVGIVNIYLLGNNWYCNCDLKPLIDLYHIYEDRFADIPYCKGPPSLYGVLFANVIFGKECISKSDEEIISQISSTSPPEKVTTALITTSSSTEQTSTTEMAANDDNMASVSPFQMRCLSVLNMPSDEDESSSSSEQMEYFLFAPPCHEFELILLKNNSVQVVVEDADEPINIVWFSDAIENFVYTIDGITIDYNCEGYTKPYLIVDNLLEDSAYTFCLVPSATYAITPFNCLPLYVPAKLSNDDVVWISTDEKQFTIGIVCLIFACSMLFGGVIAYFGIKAYPDLLEGSRHVLVVKKSDKTCYVSTITDYAVDEEKSKDAFNKKSILKSISLPCAQATKLPKDNQEIAKEEYLKEAEDHYELPCIYNKTHNCQLECIPNKYASSPMSPPPLPKRNNDVLNSSNSEQLTERYFPKFTF